MTEKENKTPNEENKIFFQQLNSLFTNIKTANLEKLKETPQDSTLINYAFDNTTALIHAIREYGKNESPNRFIIIQSLLDLGATVENPKLLNISALLIAVMINSEKVVKLLIDNNADPNFKYTQKPDNCFDSTAQVFDAKTITQYAIDSKKSGKIIQLLEKPKKQESNLQL